MAGNKGGHGDHGDQADSDGHKDRAYADRGRRDRGGHGDHGDQADSDGHKDRADADRGRWDRRGHGDPRGQADSDGDKDQTYADREEWHRFRADEDILPGSAPLKSLSYFQKLARAAAAYARNARQKLNMSKYFNAGEKKGPTNITSEELLEFKVSLEHSLKEVKAAVEKSAKDQKALIEASSSANSEVMQKALHRLEEVSKEVKAAVDAGVNAQKTSADTAEKIFKLMDELSSTLKEVPPSKASDLLGRLEKLAFWPKKVDNIWELVSDYAAVIGAICLIAGLYDPKYGLLDQKVEQSLIERFFPNKNPGLFEDIGRRAREVMFKDFEPDMSVLIEPQLADITFFSSMNKSPMQIIVAHQLNLRQGAMGLDIKVDSMNHVSSLFSFPCVFGADYVPKVRMCYPFRDSSITLDAFYENAAVRANVSMHPIRGDAMLSLSGLFGTKAFNLGGHMEVDTGNVRRNSYSVGGSVISSAFTAGLQYNNRDQLLVMMSHKLQKKSMVKDLMHRSAICKDLHTLFAPSPTSELTIAAQLIHCSSTQSTVAAVGIEYVDPWSVLKFRLASSGVLSTVWKNKLGEGFTLGVKGQVNVTDLGADPRVGVSLCFNPTA